MDIIWPIKNKIFAYAEKKTIVKFVIQQVQITILEYLEEEEHMPILYMEELQALLQPIWVIFVIKVY